MPVAAVASLAFFAAQWGEGPVPADAQLHPQVQVEGTASCPVPAAVAARLANLLPRQGAVEKPDRARLSEEGGDLVVVLERADGVVLGTRRLSLTHACEDLAAATAVFLAAWESDVHPEFTSSLAVRAPTPASTHRHRPPVPPVVASPPSWTADAGLALGLGGSLEDSPAVAGGAAIGLWMAASGARTSLRAEMEGQSERQMLLRDGRASWRRWSLGLGLERPLFAAAGGAAGWLRWFALGRLAWLQLRGEGFAVNHRDNAFDPGATVGLRGLLTRGRWSAWVELAGSAWPVRHDLWAGGGADDTAVLPVAELFLRVGGGLGLAR